MKKIRIMLFIASMAIVFFACEDNEIMPSYSKKGTATSTVATITPSKARAAKSETITITLKYVNPSADPLQTVVLKAKVGATDYVTVQTFDTQSEAKDTYVTHDVTYVTPAAAGTVTFDMVITSQKEYPQITRTSVTVQ